MAITTYAELKTAVARWTGGSDDSTAALLGLTSTIDDLVTVAEARIFREARTRDMENPLNATVSSGVIALPMLYVELKFAYVDGSPTAPLERRSAEWIYANYPSRSGSGQPKFIGREGTNFIFGPYPGTYTIKGSYYKRFAALSTAVHALFTANPDLYLFGCLAESGILIGQDARIPLWESKYQKILMDVNGEDDREDHSGSTLRMRVS